MRISEQTKDAFSHKLVSMKVIWDGSDMFMMSFPDESISFRGTPEGFAKFLKSKLHASDAITKPSSKRGVTYMDMVNAIMDGTCRNIWVWNHIVMKLDGRVYTEE